MGEERRHEDKDSRLDGNLSVGEGNMSWPVHGFKVE